jgi:hypothetical protein
MTASTLDDVKSNIDNKNRGLDYFGQLDNSDDLTGYSLSNEMDVLAIQQSTMIKDAIVDIKTKLDSFIQSMACYLNDTEITDIAMQLLSNTSIKQETSIEDILKDETGFQLLCQSLLQYRRFDVLEELLIAQLNIQNGERAIQVKLLLAMIAFEKKDLASMQKYFSELGNAMDVMWLLCYYSNNKKYQTLFANEITKNMIEFLYANGIKPEDCYRKSKCAVDYLIKNDDVAFKKKVLSGKTLYKNRLHNQDDETNRFKVATGFIGVPLLYALGNAAIFMPTGGLLTLVVGGITIASASAGAGYAIAKKLTINALEKEKAKNKVTSQLDIKGTAFESSLQSIKRAQYDIRPETSQKDKIFKPVKEFIHSHTKITKPWMTIYQFLDDLGQPYIAGLNFAKGAMKCGSGLMGIFSKAEREKEAAKCAKGGMMMLQGVAQLITTPFTYLIKMPYRGLLTLAEPLLNNNAKRQSRKLDNIAKKVIATLDDKNEKVKLIGNHFTQNQQADKQKDNYRETLFNLAVLHEKFKKYQSTNSTIDNKFKTKEKQLWQENKSLFTHGFFTNKETPAVNEINKVREYCDLFLDKPDMTRAVISH